MRRQFSYRQRGLDCEDMKSNIKQLVDELREQDIDLPDGNVRIGCFGDSEALSNALVLLMAAGIKRATCSLLWSWEFEGDALPKPGDIEIVRRRAAGRQLVAPANLHSRPHTPDPQQSLRTTLRTTVCCWQSSRS